MQFYVPELQPGRVLLPEEESRHLLKAVRARLGDAVQLTDGRGHKATAQLAQIGKHDCTLHVTEVQAVPRPVAPLHLYIAPTKNADRMEWLVEKATELAVAGIHFMETHRSERAHLNLARMQRLAVAALKQCGHAWLPQLTTDLKFEQAVKQLDVPGFIAWLPPQPPPHLLFAVQQNPGAALAVFIGPEGDFTPEEVDLALQHGVAPVSLGPTVLRTETAGLYVCSMNHAVSATSPNLH